MTKPAAQMLPPPVVHPSLAALVALADDDRLAFKSVNFASPQGTRFVDAQTCICQGEQKGPVAQVAQVALGDEAGTHQPMTGEVSQPLCVFDVGLAARHLRQPPRIDHFHLDAACFEDFVQRDPVHAGRFDRHGSDAACFEPCGERYQIGGEGAELAHRLRVAVFGDGHVMFRGAAVDAGGAGGDPAGAGAGPGDGEGELRAGEGDRWQAGVVEPVRPTEGVVRYKGTPVTGVNTEVGYITQDDNLLPWRTLRENVEVALEFRGVPPGYRREQAAKFIAMVGLSGFDHLYPHELSGGMRKRTALVRTLIYDPAVILMDEPFGPLDAQTRVILQDELLKIWQGSGKTVVFVTHDLVEAIALSDEIVLFSRAPGTIKQVYRVPLGRPRDVFRIHADPNFPAFYEHLWRDLKEEIAEVELGVS